jgi:hypothetical protein
MRSIAKTYDRLSAHEQHTLRMIQNMIDNADPRATVDGWVKIGYTNRAGTIAVLARHGVVDVKTHTNGYTELVRPNDAHRSMW